MKRLLLSLLVAGTAIGGSAFKNVEPHSNGRSISAGYFVQTSANNYTYVSSSDGDAGICRTTTTRPCKYTVPASNSVPSTGPYNETQLQGFGLSPSDPTIKIWHPAP